MTMSVQAKDPLAARKIAQAALVQFPKPIPHDNVKHMVIENRDFLTSHVCDLNRKIVINEDITNTD